LKKEKPLAIKTAQANVGIAVGYKKKLQGFIDAMNRDYTLALTNEYRDQQDRIALDASPANELTRVLLALEKKWSKIADKYADEEADLFVGQIYATNRSSTKSAAKSVGLNINFDQPKGGIKKLAADRAKKKSFAVKFDLTRSMKDTLDVTIAENVALIKSIQSKYHEQVALDVYRAVAAGGDLRDLTDTLKEIYGKTHARAAFIARDQNSKANAQITRTWQQDMGIDQAIWVHSHAGKKPRESHVAAGREKLVYNVAKGAYLETNGGKWDWTWPGHSINCLPAHSKIEFTGSCKKLFRRRYAGKLHKLVTGSNEIIEATPNHPILTTRGWIPIKDVDLGDYVVKASDKSVNSLNLNNQHNVPAISELFEAFGIVFGIGKIAGISLAENEFHGDATDGEVDIIDTASFLPNEVDIAELEQFFELFFALSNEVLIRADVHAGSAFEFALKTVFGSTFGDVSGISSFFSILWRCSGGTDEISLRTIAELNALFFQAAADNISAYAVFFGDGKLAKSANIFAGDNFIRKFYNVFIAANTTSPRDSDASIFSVSADSLHIVPNGGRSILKGVSVGDYEFDRVIDLKRRDFSGHVYNIENEKNWYLSSKIITHNCRCMSKSIIPGLTNEARI